MRLCFILGTRPEIIKMSPIIRLCQSRNIPFFTIHTGQHYSFEMDQQFYQELQLPLPEYNLGIRSAASHLQSEHTGRMLIDIEKILLKERPDVVLVQGDTNTVLAAAICVRKLRTAPSYLHIRLGHVEAGLRSYDLTMTEEVNRVIADQLSDYLFVPSELAREFLLKEGIPEYRIVVTGNTIVDAVYAADKHVEKGNVIEEFDLRAQQYFFATAHRQENVDDPVRLSGIIQGLDRVGRRYGLPVIFSLHPRTKKRMEEKNIRLPALVRAITPVGFFASLELQKHARLVLTDSGGLQEEASILRVPCVTLRNTTERPETIHAGMNILADSHPDSIVAAVETMMNAQYTWNSVYGDGRAAERILNYLMTVV